MVKRCVYCNSDISENSVVDICKPCMHQVWGPRMTAAIIGGMEKERDKGNLELGEVSKSVGPSTMIEEEKPNFRNDNQETNENLDIEPELNIDENLNDVEEIESIDNLFSEQNTQNSSF